MSIEDALYALISSSTSITALLREGSTTDIRLFPGLAPQDATFPYMEYERISAMRERHLGGLSQLAHPRFQVNIWSTGYDQAKLLMQHVRVAADNYTGSTNASINIRRVFLEDDADMLEPAVGLETRRLFGRRLDFIIWHEDT